MRTCAPVIKKKKKLPGLEARCKPREINSCQPRLPGNEYNSQQQSGAYPTSHSLLAPARCENRANSIVRLLPRRMAVFRYKTRGSGIETQSIVWTRTRFQNERQRGKKSRYPEHRQERDHAIRAERGSSRLGLRSSVRLVNRLARSASHPISIAGPRRFALKHCGLRRAMAAEDFCSWVLLRPGSPAWSLSRASYASHALDTNKPLRAAFTGT